LADNISVKITADIGDLQSQFSVAQTEFAALTQELDNLARQAADTGLTDELKTQLDVAAESMLQAKTKAADLGSQLEALQPTGSSLTQAFSGMSSALVEGFKELVTSSEEFGVSNANFAALLGTTEEQAAALSVALKGVGSSSEDFEATALGMEMRLKTQESAWNAYGIATRDANGALLSGQALMQNAMSAMQQYKSGTDQNEFALQVFGRTASQVYEIMRATAAAQQQYAQDMRDLGVATSGTGAQSEQLESALAREKQQWLDVEIALSQRFAPSLLSLLDWMSTDGKTDLVLFEDALKGIGTVAVIVGTVFNEAGRAIAGSVAEIIEGVEGLAHVGSDVVRGDWNAVAADAKAAFGQMGNTFHSVIGDMIGDAKKAGNDIAAVWGGITTGGDSPSQQSGSKNFTPIDPAKVQAEASKAAEIARRLADEIAQSDNQLAQKQIESAERVNNFDLQMGRESLDQWKQNAQQEAGAKLSAELSYLDKKLVADQKDVVAFQKDLDQISAAYQTHDNALAQTDNEYAEKKRQQNQAALQDAIQLNSAEYSNTVSKLNQEVAQHQISAEQRRDAEVALATSVEQAELAMFDAAHVNADGAVHLTEQETRQRQAIIDTFNKRIDTSNNQLLAEEQQKWTTLSNSIRSSFNSAIDGMLFQGKSFGQGMEMIAEGIVKAFLAMGEKIAEDWIETQIEALFTTKTTQTTSALSQVTAEAGVAAATAYAQWAAFPPLAEAMAAEAFANTMAWGSAAGLATGAWEIPGTMRAILHEGEMVVPRPFAEDVRRNGGALGGGGGDLNMHYAPTINAREPASLSQMLSRESGEMLAWLNRQFRNGAIHA
jgi:hypothetical protein